MDKEKQKEIERAYRAENRRFLITLAVSTTVEISLTVLLVILAIVKLGNT